MLIFGSCGTEAFLAGTRMKTSFWGWWGAGGNLESDWEGSMRDQGERPAVETRPEGRGQGCHTEKRKGQDWGGKMTGKGPWGQCLGTSS